MKRILNATLRQDKIAAFERHLADTWQAGSELPARLRRPPSVIGVEDLPSVLNRAMIVYEETFERGYLKARNARLWSVIDETGARIDLLIIGTVVFIWQADQSSL